MDHPTDPPATVILTAAQFRQLQQDAAEFLADADDDDDWFEMPAAELGRLLRRAAVRNHPHQGD